MISARELREHRSSWIGLHGRVYDVSSFLAEHPGGRKILADACGRDSTAAFAAVHDKATLEKLELPVVGTMEASSAPPPQPTAPGGMNTSKTTTTTKTISIAEDGTPIVTTVTETTETVGGESEAVVAGLPLSPAARPQHPAAPVPPVPPAAPITPPAAPAKPLSEADVGGNFLAAMDSGALKGRTAKNLGATATGKSGWQSLDVDAGWNAAGTSQEPDEDAAQRDFRMDPEELFALKNLREMEAEAYLLRTI